MFLYHIMAKNTIIKQNDFFAFYEYLLTKSEKIIKTN